jgi:hypothetical protein
VNVLFLFKLVKTNKVCNKLQIKDLKSITRVAIEGLHNELEYSIGELQALWTNSSKFRWLFSHPKKHLSRHVTAKG